MRAARGPAAAYAGCRLGMARGDGERGWAGHRRSGGRRGRRVGWRNHGGRWICEVRPSLSPHLPESFRADIPQRLLPAAALIAYHQPMAQSQLVDMLGQRAYDHVRDLAKMGLIDRRRDGLTRRLTTTRRFAEYFGCPEVEYRKVRTWFREEASKMGLTSAQLAASLAPEEQLTINEFSDDSETSEEPLEAEE